MSKPLAIDLCCGLGGWTDGLLAEGYDVIGFDIERHVYGDLKYPAQLVVQDILTLHGSQFRDAALIVASPPCQRFSYMAMPWKLAKAQAAAIRADETGEELRRLTALFDACFRIQREASAAAGRRIPIVVENVKGAQPWVGRAAWNFGSFYLWGDIPAIMPRAQRATKNNGGSWFAIGSPGQKQTGCNPDGRHDGSIKLGGSWFHGYRKGQGPRNHGSKSVKRKMASALIAKIPFELSSHIARAWRPVSVGEAA